MPVELAIKRGWRRELGAGGSTNGRFPANADLLSTQTIS